MAALWITGLFDAERLIAGIRRLHNLRRKWCARFLALAKLDQTAGRYARHVDRRYRARRRNLAAASAPCRAQHRTERACLPGLPYRAERLRSVPEIIMGIIFVAAVGFGALPGVLALALHSVGMVGKFYAEAIEHVDPNARSGARRGRESLSGHYACGAAAGLPQLRISRSTAGNIISAHRLC